jgi:hypothetical protein
MFLGVGKHAHDNQSHHDQSGYQVCTMAATPGERMNKATGANRGD